MRINKKNGFTLIELIIVIVIIGILASIAAPMMGGVKAKAIAAEAATALGTIRTAVKSYYAENNNIPNMLVIAAYGQRLGLNPDDFDGVYFSKECYSISGDCYGDYNHPLYNFVTCMIDDTKAVKGPEAIALVDNPPGRIRLYISTGQITQHGFKASGFMDDDEYQGRYN